MDVHTTYANDYIRECVKALEQSGADNVGGPWVARGRGIVSQAIAYLDETMTAPRRVLVAGDLGFWDRFGWLFAAAGVALASAAVGFLLTSF